MADLVKMWTPEIGYSFNEGEYTYTVIGSQQLNAEATSKDKTSYFSVQESFYLNGVLYTVTSMDECYRGCVNLISAPSIPASVTSMNYCFEGCTNLTGDIEVNNNPTSYESIFDNTTNSIFIVDNTINNSSNWQTIAQDYENVHYEATDNQAPQLGVLQVVRGKYELDSNNNWRWTEDDSGDDIKVTLNATLFTDLLPESWRSNIYIERFYIEINNTEILPGVSSRQYIVDSSSYTEESGIRKYKSPLILYILDYENSGNLKINVTDNYNHQSSTATETVYNLFVMFDFFPGGQGAAIGKASERNGLDIAIPTTIGEGLLPASTYTLSDDTEADINKSYYELQSNGEYEEVIHTTNDNPKLLGWYEHSDTIDLTNYQLVIGQYNQEKTGPKFIIGNGENSSNRSNLMEVGTNLIQIGSDTTSKVHLDYHSLQLIDKEGNTYFHVSDLRNANDIATLSHTYIGDGSQRNYLLEATAIDTSYSVTLNGTEVTSGISKYLSSCTFNTAPAIGDEIVITYESSSDHVKAYTIGIRGNGQIGIMSIAEGYNNIATGSYAHAEGLQTEAYYCSHSEGYKTKALYAHSHAEGYGARASGGCAHAQGFWTIASKTAQTVLGTYNIEDTATTTVHPNGDSSYGQHAVIIGNGTVSTPSNALTVDWNGNVDIAAGAKYKINGTNLLDILYPVGSCYVTSTNSNPQARLGGTWALIDKSFAYAWITNPFTFNTTNTQSGASAIVLHGHTVECRLAWQNKVALSDNTVVIATCNFANNGLNAAQHVTYNVGYADALNAVGLFHQSWSGATMTVDVFDWVTRATSYPTETGQACDLSFTFVVEEHTSMVDSFCNQFIWKRTA